VLFGGYAGALLLVLALVLPAAVLGFSSAFRYHLATMRVSVRRDVHVANKNDETMETTHVVLGHTLLIAPTGFVLNWHVTASNFRLIFIGTCIITIRQLVDSADHRRCDN